MKIFSHYASRKNEYIVARAFEVKKEIPVNVDCGNKQNDVPTGGKAENICSLFN
jgi:hypothetical protein